MNLYIPYFPEEIIFFLNLKLQKIQIVVANLISLPNKLNLWRKLFKGVNYSRAETIRGNTVYEKY